MHPGHYRVQVNEVARSTLKRVLFLSAAFALIAVSVVFAANWYAIAALYRPTPTPKPVLLNYTNRTHNFSLKFPQYWADSEPRVIGDPADNPPPSYIVKFQSPQIEGSNIPISITIMAKDLPPELGNETLEGYVEKAEHALKVSANNYSLISITDSTVSGLPAKIVSWSMGDEGNTLINDQAIFMKGARVYIITLAVLSDFYDKAAYGFNLVTSTFKFKQSSAPASTPASTP
jgi:hypothetical protein